MLRKTGEILENSSENVWNYVENCVILLKLWQLYTKEKDEPVAHESTDGDP